MYKLIIEDDEGKTTVVPLIRDEITIGRKEGNTIRLTERNVSRKHAKLLKQNGSVFIEDLSSYNGIKVNGDRIAGRAPINEGDRIQIGDYQLALKADKAAQAGAAPGGASPSPSGIPTMEMHEQKTTPFIKENGAAPASMMDMAPTVQTPLMSPSGQQETPARLVVVSSNFAGQEFVLDKAAIVIGRTDENDVVINHRSISRHHAKIVKENGAHFHIVDLQSANGVRVNGEEYGKVELRKGDHIDLGHVRLRFVAAGEDFLFDRDAQVVDVGGGKKSRLGVMLGLMAVMLLIVSGAVVLVMRGAKTPVTGGENGQSGQKGADVEGQVAKLLLDADVAMKNEQWEQAIAKCEEALKLDPAQDLARDKQQKAEAEKKNGAAFKNFLAAAAKGDYDGAVASFGEVAEDSIYRQKGADRYTQVKKAYLRGHLEAAKKAKAQGRCEEARQHVEAALTVDEGNLEAQEIVKSCGAPAHQAVASTRPPREREPKEREPKEREPKHEHVAAATPKHEAEPQVDQMAANAAAERKFQEAQDAYVHGQYANAIEIARTLIKTTQAGKAWRIIGASSCYLKDRGGATQAWNRLDAQGRQFLRYVCFSHNGITVP
jgi:pSer/pThr/pTyr-binding forkhead associated (FHA) protein